jgi:glycosyltransferase involved in cell wall biosynthesis
MKIAIVAPSPVPYTIGGSELLFSGMQQSINKFTPHQCELIKLPVKESNFWELIDSYYSFYMLDLSHFDLVISTKYPSWMIRHKNHSIYMVHHLRGLFDTYSLFDEPYEIPSDLRKGVVKKIHEICSKKEYSGERTNELFSFLFQLKSEDEDYPKSLFKFPGPFIREIIHYLDAFALHSQNISQYFSMSRTVLMRLDYFPREVNVKILHPPSNIGDFKCSSYDYIFTASRLDSPKRINLIIEAMHFVPHQVKLKIAGTGPEYKKLKELAEGDKRIEFLGFVPESQLVELYSGALTIVFIPYDEDYGLITLEGMMSRKPIITANDSGGPLEFVINGETGFIVDPVPEKIAEKINLFIENKEIAIRSGYEAYTKVKNISWKRFVFELLGENTINNTQKKKVLVLSTYPCFPPRGGGQHRLYNIYSRLVKEYEVTLCSIVESNKGHQCVVLPEGFEQICIPQSKEHAEAQWLMEQKIGKNLYDVAMIENIEKSDNYVQTVKTLMAKSDIIIFSHPYLFNLKKFIEPNKKIVYDAVDIEYLQKSEFINEKNLLSKILNVEQNACNEASQVWCTSEEDRQGLITLYNISPEKIVVVPNGVDSKFIKFITPEEKILAKQIVGLSQFQTILFIGSWHPPNLKALEFIIKTLSKKLKNTKFLVIGSIKDYYLHTHKNLPNNVLAFGVVDEIEKYEIYKIADIAINPMFSGSGTNLKILDYMSAGIPVITTEIGARGIMITNNRDAIICKSDRFLKEIEKLLGNPEMQETLRLNARKVVETTYSWDNIAKIPANSLKR